MFIHPVRFQKTFNINAKVHQNCSSCPRPYEDTQVTHPNRNISLHSQYPEIYCYIEYIEHQMLGQVQIRYPELNLPKDYFGRFRIRIASTLLH